LERPPSVAEEGWSDAALLCFAGDAGLEWVPIVGEDNRPVALAGRPLGLDGEPRLAPVDRVEPDTNFADAAQRAMERPPSERMVPFLRCDSRGRYVAIVRVERVVAELTDAYRHQSLGSAPS
jgi:hypothetical protein